MAQARWNPGFFSLFREHVRLADLEPRARTDKLNKIRVRRKTKAAWRDFEEVPRQLLINMLAAIKAVKVQQQEVDNLDTAYQDLPYSPRSSYDEIEAKADGAEALIHGKAILMNAFTTLVDAEREFGRRAEFLLAYDGHRSNDLGTEINGRIAALTRLRRRQVNASEWNPKKRQKTVLQEHVKENGWFYRKVGTGSDDTRLGLWLQVDANHNINDRGVIKDVYQDPQAWMSRECWRNPKHPPLKTPYEVITMRKLTDTGSPNVVHLREWSLHVEKMMYRMYMCYSPFPDTLKLLEHYKRNDTPIPEPAIWCIFESLAKAGLLMKQGFVPPGAPQPSWTATKHWYTEIVHRDIKPGNVFTGLHSPQQANSEWAMYPTFKLGDYGLAFETWPSRKQNEPFPPQRPHPYPPPHPPFAYEPDRDHRGNPHDYLNRGTPLYRAPEQLEANNNGTPLDEQTIVWGVRMTIMQLMCYDDDQIGVYSFADCKEVDDETGRRANMPEFTDDANEYYSAELRQLVYLCIEYDASARPDFIGLLAIIGAYTTGPPAAGLDRALGARLSTPADRRGRDHSLEGLGEDRYALGMGWTSDTDGSSSSSESDSDSYEDENEDDDGGDGRGFGAGGGGGGGRGGDDDDSDDRDGDGRDNNGNVGNENVDNDDNNQQDAGNEVHSEALIPPWDIEAERLRATGTAYRHALGQEYLYDGDADPEEEEDLDEEMGEDE